VEYRYISADNHLDIVWLPKDVWTKRVARKYRDRVPRVVETDKGTFWEWEGAAQIEQGGAVITTASASGNDNAKLIKRFEGMGMPLPAGSLGPGDPNVHLQHMDRAAIYSNVIFGGTRKWRVDDPELRAVVYGTYNDWLVDEFCAVDRERLVGLPNLPTSLPEVCVDEIQRLAKEGAKGFDFSVWDVAKPLYDEIWEPVWAAAEETGLPLCWHIGDKAGTPYPPNRRGASKAHFSTAPTNIMKPIADLIFGGALERHPGLKICIAEANIGWVPYFVDWMDRQQRERPVDPEVQLDLLPSELVRRQMRFTFEEDMIGARLIGEDWSHLKEIVMWGADYPHNHVTWPDPEPLMPKLLGHLDPALRREIVFDRAREFWRIKAPAPVAP
jgi:uncharacterized protein